MQFQFLFTGVTIGASMVLAIKIWGVFWFMVSVTLRRAICCAVMLVAAEQGVAASYLNRVDASYTNALAEYQKQSTNTATVLAFLRASFDSAELARADDRRETIAERGVTAARALIARQPTNAAAHYWLGMNLAQLARTKTLGALKLVREMETEFIRAIQLDPTIDYAGAHRSLGLLYRDAPGWPTSIGSKQRARQHLEKAVQLAGVFPENHLCLLETYLEWKERQNFRRQLSKTKTVLAEAKTTFTGPQWEWTWADWNKRWRDVQAKASDL